MPRARKKKETVVELSEPKVLDSNLEDIVADRFSRYSRYIIQERALPDARDGLKPVQRRILWSMEEDGNTYNKPYRKSARTAGNVIGNYHPHGESSVYDAIVRLSQDWKSPIPLIDMQGNNGSIDDDPAAAMRYTEARLSRLAGYLLEDIDKETVEWAPNYSDEKLEPTVLPARYPNLLINGITGIAAGYATNIPPHNFNEVIDAAIYRIEHPDCPIDELLDLVHGPDFPTGGLIIGSDGWRQALKTGKGRVTVRSKAVIEEGKTINQIVITEIPYEVIKSAMVRKMDEIRLNAKVSGILDVRDESDRKGLRIVVDLKKEANAQAILNYFYKNTDLQTYYHYNVIAIVRKTPKLLSLADALDAFLVHREEVIINRSKFDLQRKQDRLHIVEGLQKAVSVLDEVVALIRKSNGKADSKKRLMERFGFSEPQAEAIVTMQLYRLSNTDVIALEKEAQALRKEIEKLEGIIKTPSRRRKLMIKELKEISEAFPMPRRTQIVNDAEEIVIDDRDMIADEQVMAVVSRQGYVKRVSMRSFASSSNGTAGLKEGDSFIFNAPVSTLDTLLVFTDKGRFGQIPVYQIEEKKWKDLGTHYSSLLKPEMGEQIVRVFAQRNPASQVDVVLATKAGQIRRIHHEDLPMKTRSRLVALMGLNPEDSLEHVVYSAHNEDQLVLVSKEGYGFKMDVSEIPASKGKGKGVRSINLGVDDQLQAMLAADQEYLVLENNEGAFKKIALSSIDTFKRPARGTRLYKAVKSHPLEVFDARMVSARQTLSFADASLPALDVSTLPKMEPSATWSTVGTLANPTGFESLDLRLENGFRTPEEQPERENNLTQLTLFDQSAQESQ